MHVPPEEEGEEGQDATTASLLRPPSAGHPGQEDLRPRDASAPGGTSAPVLRLRRRPGKGVRLPHRSYRRRGWRGEALLFLGRPGGGRDVHLPTVPRRGGPVSWFHPLLLRQLRAGLLAQDAEGGNGEEACGPPAGQLMQYRFDDP